MFNQIMGLFDNSKKHKAREKEFLELGEDLEPHAGDYGPAGKEKKAEEPLDMMPMTPPAMPRTDELTNSKIAALKAEIEALRQRVKFIESKLEIEKEGMAHKYGTPATKDTGWHY